MSWTIDDGAVLIAGVPQARHGVRVERHADHLRVTVVFSGKSGTALEKIERQKIQQALDTPAQDAARAALSSEACRRFRRLHAEIATAERQRDLAAAKHQELTGRRAGLVAEAGPGLAKRLIELDAGLSTAARTRDDAEHEISTLRPLLVDARAAAERQLHGAAAGAIVDVRGELRNERAVLLYQMAEAVGPLLTRLLAVDEIIGGAPGAPLVDMAGIRAFLDEEPPEVPLSESVDTEPVGAGAA